MPMENRAIQLPRVIERGVGVNNLSPPSPPPAQFRKQTEGNIDPRTVEPGERRREVHRH